MRATLLLAAALFASGCLSAVASDERLPDPADGQVPDGPGAGTAAGHGAPQRTEGPVTVTLGPDGYVAAQDVEVRNDFGGAADANVRLATRNGAITVAAGAEGGYRLAAHLEGRGKTEQEARAALATLTVLNQDDLAGGVLAIGMQVRFDDPPSPAPAPLPVTACLAACGDGGALQRSASIVATLPAAPALDLEADATNGGLGVEGLHGPRLRLDTTNGAINVQGAWDKADLDSTNGGIHLDALVNDLAASTTNGGIEGTLRSQRTCSQSLSTTNGGVSLTVKDGGHGYKVKGSTTNGHVAIAVAGAHASGKDVQAETPGFHGEAIQVTLSARSTNGNVRVSSA
ncbi:MAG TPA: DUF4097 family beta strand repeat-containing protein [Candidatus Thermoplasmatota archaeon]|nr:DUF4097 family beta strand repeat-containing protein [Candidatus Thermoplasmatota archaeon]